MRLLNSQNSCCLRLSEATGFDDAGDLEGETSSGQFLAGVWQAEVGKDVAGGFGLRCELR